MWAEPWVPLPQDRPPWGGAGGSPPGNETAGQTKLEREERRSGESCFLQYLFELYVPTPARGDGLQLWAGRRSQGVTRRPGRGPWHYAFHSEFLSENARHLAAGPGQQPASTVSLSPVLLKTDSRPALHSWVFPRSERRHLSPAPSDARSPEPGGPGGALSGLLLKTVPGH